MNNMKDSHRLTLCLTTKTIPAAPTCHRIHAFSLYDTLVTLVVVSIVAMIAISSFRYLIASQRMITAMNMMIAALHTARSEAIKRGEHAVLCPSKDGRRCGAANGNLTFWHHGYLLYIDKNANHQQDENEAAVRVFDPAPGLRILSTRSSDSVAYKPNGLAPGSNMTFTFCAEQPQYPARTVIVSNSGRPRTSTKLPDGRNPDCSASVASL
jgi:type IV fimbrial biogenesis protein FimT